MATGGSPMQTGGSPPTGGASRNIPAADHPWCQPAVRRPIAKRRRDVRPKRRRDVRPKRWHAATGGTRATTSGGTSAMPTGGRTSAGGNTSTGGSSASAGGSRGWRKHRGWRSHPEYRLRHAGDANSDSRRTGGFGRAQHFAQSSPSRAAERVTNTSSTFRRITLRRTRIA